MIFRLGRARLVPVLLALGAAVACTPGPVDPIARQLSAAALTRDGEGSYSLAYSGGAATMSGAPVAGDNTRVVFWPRQQAATVDQLTCATWAAQSSDGNQEGAALRVRNTFTGTRAITITKGVIFGVDWVFNVHLWEKEEEVPAAIKQFDLARTFAAGGQLKPLPWRMCARAAGAHIDFKVWTVDGPEPDWGDPTHGGGFDLPEGWTAPGHAGWYAGHISTGQQIGYTDLVPAP